MDENYFFVVVGLDNNIYVQEVKCYYVKLGIVKCCWFMGEVKGVEKSQVYQLLDIFVLFIYLENFGVVVLEVLVVGLFVVVSINVFWVELEEY